MCVSAQRQSAPGAVAVPGRRYSAGRAAGASESGAAPSGAGPRGEADTSASLG